MMSTKHDKNENKFVPRTLPLTSHPTVGALAAESAPLFQHSSQSKSTRKWHTKNSATRKSRRSKSLRAIAFHKEDKFEAVLGGPNHVRSTATTDNKEAPAPRYSAISQSPFVSKRNKMRRRRASFRRRLVFGNDDKATTSSCASTSTLSRSSHAVESSSGNPVKPCGRCSLQARLGHCRRQSSSSSRAKNCESVFGNDSRVSQWNDATSVMLGIVSGTVAVDNESAEPSFQTPSKLIKEDDKTKDAAMCDVYNKCYCEHCFNVDFDWENNDPREQPKVVRPYHPRVKSKQKEEISFQDFLQKRTQLLESDSPSFLSGFVFGSPMCSP